MALRHDSRRRDLAPERERDVGERGAPLEQLEVLEDEAEVSPQVWQRRARQQRHALARDHDLAAVRPLGTVEQAQERGLAGAAAPGDEHEFARPYREVRILQDGDAAATTAHACDADHPASG